MHIRTYFFTTFSILVDISYPSAGSFFKRWSFSTATRDYDSCLLARLLFAFLRSLLWNQNSINPPRTSMGITKRRRAGAVCRLKNSQNCDNRLRTQLNEATIAQAR
jgi:hypothetical protein